MPKGEGLGPYAGMAWTHWFYLNVHVGPMGGHRNADKTRTLVERCAWWPGMAEDVAFWVDRCWQCLQYRRRVTKGLGGFFVPAGIFPFRHVMMDFEGPSSPVARSGATHVLEFICLLSHAVLYEPVAGLGHSQVRRAFCRVICRAGTIPALIAHDRGSEFWNLLMRELAALLHIQLKPGAPYRPPDQAGIEREHVEFRVLEGAFVNDVFKSFPNEWESGGPV